jgi:hypothetical protein
MRRETKQKKRVDAEGNLTGESVYREDEKVMAREICFFRRNI